MRSGLDCHSSVVSVRTNPEKFGGVDWGRAGKGDIGKMKQPADQPRAGILSQEQAAQIKRLVVHKK